MHLPGEGHRFLELSCGNGDFARLVRDRLGIPGVGVDTDANALKLAEQFGLTTVNSDPDGTPDNTVPSAGYARRCSQNPDRPALSIAP